MKADEGRIKSGQRDSGVLKSRSEKHKIGDKKMIASLRSELTVQNGLKAESRLSKTVPGAAFPGHRVTASPH